MPARAVTNVPRLDMLRLSFCSEKIDCTKPTRRCSPSSPRRRSAPNALTVSTPETSSTRCAESWPACSIASRERRLAAGWWATTVSTSNGHKRRGDQRQPYVVDPQNGQQGHDEHAVDEHALSSCR